MFCKICGKMLKGAGEIRYCCGQEYRLEPIISTVNYTECPVCGSQNLLETESKEFLEKIVQTYTTRICIVYRCLDCGHRW